MRYVEFHDGTIILGPSSHFGHKDLLFYSSRQFSEIKSAGFLESRYSCEEKWKAYGKSIALGVQHSSDLIVPNELFVIKVGHLESQLFSNCFEILALHGTPVPAEWGMSNPGIWGECPVFAPHHPSHVLSVIEITQG